MQLLAEENLGGVAERTLMDGRFFLLEDEEKCLCSHVNDTNGTMGINGRRCQIGTAVVAVFPQATATTVVGVEKQPAMINGRRGERIMLEMITCTIGRYNIELRLDPQDYNAALMVVRRCRKRDWSVPPKRDPS